MSKTDVNEMRIASAVNSIDFVKDFLTDEVLVNSLNHAKDILAKVEVK